MLSAGPGFLDRGGPLLDLASAPACYSLVAWFCRDTYPAFVILSVLTMSKIDLTDLRILDELQKTGSISRTAEEIRLSQPSVSVRLSNLRRHFKDPLFVRTSHGMRPTPKASHAVTAARQALKTLEQAVMPEDEFDAKTSQRTFRLCMTDVGQIAILPELLAWLKSNAPALSINVISPRGEVERMLELGDADVAIGVRLKRQKGIVGQTIFQERFVCLVSKNHPRIQSSMGKREFLREAHVVPQILSSSMGSWVMDQTLSLQKVPRRIAVRVPSLLGLSQIVANTDLLAVVPSHIARTFAKDGHLRMLKLPLNLPSYEVAQYWHRRYQTDSGHRWLRSTIMELFASSAKIGRQSNAKALRDRATR
jgi:DNA-binding transcriptional LysR family regulator